MTWDKIDEILEDEDIERTNYDTYSELEFGSALGEDVVFALDHTDDPKTFVEAFSKYAWEFDVDEHVELWIPSRGKNGTPSSIRDLVEDAEDIKDKLEHVARRLRKAA